jgi:hypothetical protein
MTVTSGRGNVVSAPNIRGGVSGRIVGELVVAVAVVVVVVMMMVVVAAVMVVVVVVVVAAVVVVVVCLTRHSNCAQPTETGKQTNKQNMLKHTDPSRGTKFMLSSVMALTCVLSDACASWAMMASSAASMKKM